MVKHTNCLSVFDHFVELALKGLTLTIIRKKAPLQKKKEKLSILSRACLGKHYQSQEFFRSNSIVLNINFGLVTNFELELSPYG